MRSWYEVAKDVDIWKKLRLIIVHATDIYIQVKTSQSPFNVIVAELTTFNKNQIEDLIQRYGFQLTVCEFEYLVSLTGGLSHLVQLSLYHSKRYRLPLETVVKDAISERKVFKKF